MSHCPVKPGGGRGEGGCRQTLGEGKTSAPQGQPSGTYPVSVAGPPFSSLLPRIPHCAHTRCLPSAPFILLETVLKEAPDRLHIHKRVWDTFPLMAIVPTEPETHILFVSAAVLLAQGQRGFSKSLPNCAQCS